MAVKYYIYFFFIVNIRDSVAATAIFVFAVYSLEIIHC